MKIYGQRFVLLDRDGTLIVDRHYLADYRLVKLLPGAAEGLKNMLAMGLGLVIISNQSGIGRGYFGTEELDLVHKRMMELLSTEGVTIHGTFYCHHAPADNCKCRKPQTGLVEMAASTLKFDPAQSFMIGDKSCDINLGKNINATTFLVQAGHQEFKERNPPYPDYIVNDLVETSEIIGKIVPKRQWFL